MRSVLQIKSATAGARSEAVIRELQKRDDLKVEVIDLNAGTPNYEQLLDRIFAADAVAVW
jgi:hypothetical protein